MQLRVLGSSGTAPAPGNPASGYLVSSGSTTIWMDAGPGTYMALLEHVAPESVDAVLLSHMHADHCSDLFALFHGLKYILGAERRVPVVAPDGSRERLAGFLQAATDHPLFAQFDVHIAQPLEVMRFGSLEVSIQAAHHSVPALAYRVAADGAALGYTGDTGPSEMVEQHLTGVDLLLAEASLQDGGDPYPFHLTARQAGALADTAGASRLLLTHIPASLDSEESLRQAAATYPGELGLARPGDVYMIGVNHKDG